MSEAFELDPRLLKDCDIVGDLPLCRILLMDDARFPWMILVPKRQGAREIWDLHHQDQIQLMREINQSARLFKLITHGCKINIGTLGNIVPQLHVHVVSRLPTDVAWPKPVWGYGSPLRYHPPCLRALTLRLQHALSGAMDLKVPQ